MKFKGAGQGPRALVAEWLAGSLARAVGLPVPELVAIQVDAHLGDAEPDEEIHALVRAHLDAIEAIARGETAGGPIARLGFGERFHWLVAPSSTIIQPSAVHTGLTDDPASELDRLVDVLVR